MYSVLIDEEGYFTEDVTAELLIMKCGGAVSILPFKANAPILGQSLVYLGEGRGSIPLPCDMKMD